MIYIYIDNSILIPVGVRDNKTGKVITDVGNYIRKAHKFRRMELIEWIEIDNQEFWNFVCTTSPDACKCTPWRFQTPDLLRVIANNTSYSHNLLKMNIDLVEESESRDAAFEIYQIMVRRFSAAIKDVPKQYLTNDLIYMAVLEHMGALSELPIEKRTDGIYIASVSRWGKSLRSVPEEKRNLLVKTQDGDKKLFEIAVEVDGSSLAYVPAEERNYDLCLKGCIGNIDAISHVPVTIINPDFVEALQQNGITIPPKHRPYVQECLRTYGKLNGIAFEDTNANVVSDAHDNSAYNEICLEELPYIVSKPIFRKLAEVGIKSLGELFTLYEESVFATKFSSRVYAEISGVVNVLNCKYKNQDPMLDFEETSADYMVSKLGLSRKVAQEMEYREKSVGQLIEQSSLPLEKQVWGGFIRGIGEVSVNESLEKLSIFANYYEKNGKSISTKEVPCVEEREGQNLGEEIHMLSQELEDLKQQRAVLDGKIDATISKMVELTRKKDMSGGNSYVRK